MLGDLRKLPFATARSHIGSAAIATAAALGASLGSAGRGRSAAAAECAGVTGVVIPERRSAEVTGAVAKASAGAVEHLPVAQVRNLADFLAEAKDAGCWSYGAAAGARTRRPMQRFGGPSSCWRHPSANRSANASRSPTVAART